jgi:sugar-phosphatase
MAIVKVAALLFDMDGVLVDSRPAIDRVRRRWARKVGLDEETVVALPHGRKTSDIIAELAPDLDVREETRWLDADEERDLEGIAAIPGAAALLSSLEPSEWAVVTSSGRTLAPKRLAAAGLPLPRWIISGDMVDHGKPAPDGYQMGAVRLGCAPANCVVVEDAPAGIEAGLAAAMRVIGVATTYPREELGRATAIVRDLRGITVRRVGGALTLLLQS